MGTRYHELMVNTVDLNEETSMPRPLNNLKTLLADLRSRYGEDDDLVLQLKNELNTIEALRPKQLSLSIPYRQFIKSGTNQRTDARFAAHTGSTLRSP